MREITEKIIGAAIDVHREPGPGLLESVYEECLALEFRSAGLIAERQKLLPVNYKGKMIEGGFRLDFLVEEKVIVEIKSVEKMLAIHHAQVMSYLRLSGYRLGLLMNFNVGMMKNGIRRIIL